MNRTRTFTQFPLYSAWPLKRAGFLFTQRREKARPDDVQLTASQEYGVISQELYQHLSGNRVTAALAGVDNFLHVSKGDFVISLRAFEGGIEYAFEDGCISPAYTVLRPSREVGSGFFRYLLKSSAFLSVLQTAVTGIRDGKSVRYKDFADLVLPIPDLSVQVRIADFLDCETARIDRLIEKKRELVEKLEEKRSALSSHAVTRGLNSNVSLRHTDSPFVPLLPAHWTLPKLKQLAVVKTGITLGRKIPEGAKSVEVPYLRVANVQAGWLDLTEITTIAVLPHELEQFRLQKGDVLMNEGGDADKLGRGVIWDGQIDPCLHQNHVFAVRPREPELGEWIVLATNARHGRDYFYLNSKQSTNLASIAKSRVEQFPVPLPPKDERRAIVKHVNEKVERINRTQAKIQESIQRFRELRAALITAAVTGQIDPDTWRNRGETDRRMEAIEAEVNE